MTEIEIGPDDLRIEVERLQEAKRRALALADERAREANELRAALARLQGGDDERR